MTTSLTRTAFRHFFISLTRRRFVIRWMRTASLNRRYPVYSFATSWRSSNSVPCRSLMIASRATTDLLRAFTTRSQWHFLISSKPVRNRFFRVFTSMRFISLAANAYWTISL